MPQRSESHAQTGGNEPSVFALRPGIQSDPDSPEWNDEPAPIRNHIEGNVRRCLTQTLAHYPPWAAQALGDRAAWFEAERARDPHGINEQARRMSEQGDVFIDSPRWHPDVRDPRPCERSS